MLFGVTWEDGFQTIQYNPDLAASQQFKDFIHSRAYLFPLRFTSKQASKEISEINSDGITSLTLQQVVYLNLRYFDGVNSVWYDSLLLPQRHKDYVVKGEVMSWVGQGQKRVKIRVGIFKATYTLSTYEVQAYITKTVNPRVMVGVTDDMRGLLPQIWI